MFNFDALRALPVGGVDQVRVKAVKNLFWNDGKKWHEHVTAGTSGNIIAKTEAGFLVKFDNNEIRQVFDFVGNDVEYKAEDEIAIV